MLPDISGEEICKAIRLKHRVPIIMLTANVEEENILEGLNIGADDYIKKPFSPRQLVARVNALLRRTNADNAVLSDIISFNNCELVIDNIKHEVRKNNAIISLTPNEYKVLIALAKNLSKVFTRDELIMKIMGDDFLGFDRAIDSHIKNLRKKIENDTKEPLYILTILIIFTGVFGKLMLDSHFKDYVIEKQENSNMDIVNLINQQYNKDGKFDADLNFINALNMALLWVAIFAIIISFLLGHIFAKMLSTPIGRVINTAKLIEQGNYTTKVHEKTSTKEINDLENTINNLSETLQRQEALRKRLTADVAHELRTPLATLQSHIEAMIDGVWQPTMERLKSCHEEIIRIKKMVGDLQLLTKYKNEIKDIEKTDFELGELIKNVVMNFESQFKNKGVEIYAEGMAKIRADKDKISQVIINLLSNALKYTDSGGRVDVIIEDTELYTNIIVKDDGCGISEEDLPHIFERLYRADKSRNRLAGGAGIGLSITRAIVEAHHGTISVKSKLGVGTEFIILLPKALKST